MVQLVEAVLLIFMLQRQQNVDAMSLQQQHQRQHFGPSIQTATTSNADSDNPIGNYYHKPQPNISAAALHQRVDDLLHQIDLLPSDHFFSRHQHGSLAAESETAVQQQHQHYTLLWEAQRNLTYYYQNQLETTRHQLHVANTRHIAVARTLLRQTTTQQLPTATSDRAAASSTHTRESPAPHECCCTNDEPHTPALHTARSTPTSRRVHEDHKDTTDSTARLHQLEQERRQLQQLVAILMRLLLHR